MMSALGHEAGKRHIARERMLACRGPRRVWAGPVMEYLGPWTKFGLIISDYQLVILAPVVSY